MDAQGSDDGQPTSGAYIGSRVQRREDARLLTGRGRFVADIVLPRMLHAAFVRSTYGHARVLHVGSDDAMAIPGVARVLSAWDLPPVVLTSTRHPGILPTPQPVLVSDRARFVGEPVAIVLAVDRYVAEDAAAVVDVEYEPLPVVMRVDPGATSAGPALFDDAPDNLVFTESRAFGDVQSQLESARLVVRKTLHFPRQLACPLESRGCIADYDPASGELSVWASTQAPHRLRSEIAQATGIAAHKVRVHLPDVGGAFGQKIPTHVEELAVAFAAMATGRPVKWMEDRSENLISAPHARDQRISLELAVDTDLHFTAMRAVIVGDAGAYSSNSVSCLTEAYQAARAMPGVYRIPAYAYDVVIGVTNKSPISAYRGVGYSVAQCARELLIDEAARQLSIDPFELRMRNMISPEDLPFTSATGWHFKDVSFARTAREAHDLLTRAQTAPDQDADPGPGTLRGRGISPYVEPTGVGSEGWEQITGLSVASFDAARVTVDHGGQATVVFGSPSIGQGVETSIAQVVADALGFEFSEVSVRWTDTSSAPASLSGTSASRTAVVAGGAAFRAAEVVKRQLLDVAADVLEADPADLDIRNGHVGVTGHPGARMSVAEVIRRRLAQDPGMSDSDGSLSFEATRVYDPPANYSNACVAAEVEIDQATGNVMITRLIAVEDCGTMINPTIVEGQFIGAAAQAIGSALFEQVTYSEDGQPLVATLMDYLLPTATDVVDLCLSHVENPSGDTIAGIKGMGESGMIGTVAAIACAVADAIAPFGTVDRLPLLPGTVWTALQAAAD